MDTFMTIEHNQSQSSSSRQGTIDKKNSFLEDRDKLTKESLMAYEKIQSEVMKEYASGLCAFQSNHRLYKSMPNNKYMYRIKNINNIFRNTDEKTGSELNERFLMALNTEYNYYQCLFRMTEQSHERKNIFDKNKKTNVQITPFGLASTLFKIPAFNDTDSIALYVKSCTLRSHQSTRAEATKIPLKYIHDSNPSLRETAIALYRSFKIGDCSTNIFHSLRTSRKTLFGFNKIFSTVQISGQGNNDPVKLITPGYPYMEFSVQKISSPLEVFAKGKWIDAFLYQNPKSPPLLNKFKFLSRTYFKDQIRLYKTLYRKQIKSLNQIIIPIDQFEKGYNDLANKIDQLVLSLKPIVVSSSISKELKLPSRQKKQPNRSKTRSKNCGRKKKRIQANRKYKVVLTNKPAEPPKKVLETKVVLTKKPVESRYSLFVIPKKQPFKYHERITRWRKVTGEKDLGKIRGFMDRGEYNYADQSAENLLTQIRRHDFTLTIDRILNSTKLRNTYSVKTSTGWAFLAEIETKSSSGETVRERGMISYGTYQVTGKPDVCYHRYFHPVTSRNIYDGKIPTMMQEIASTHKYDDDSDDQLISDLSDGFDGEQIRIHNEFQYVEILDKKREMVLRVFAMNADD
jgi:hypothetical protein